MGWSDNWVIIFVALCVGIPTGVIAWVIWFMINVFGEVRSERQLELERRRSERDRAALRRRSSRASMAARHTDVKERSRAS